MAKFAGKVVKVFSKELSEKELASPTNVKYGSTHKHAIQVEIDGTLRWVGFGSSKLDSFLVKNDSDEWRVLGAGSDVVFKYTENGDFLNASKNDLLIMELVEGVKFEAKAPETKPAAVAAKGAPEGKKWTDNTVGMAVGAAVNCAVSLYVNGKIKEGEIPVAIRQLYKLSEQAKAFAANGEIDNVINTEFSFTKVGITSQEAPAKKPVEKKTTTKKAEPTPEHVSNTEAEYNDDTSAPF